MANFAQINNNIVTSVTVVDNSVITVDGIEHEQLGIDYLKNIFGQNTNWVQTSYNSKFRKHYAGIGFTYDKVLDAFIPPKPYDSWLFDSNNCIWISPVPYPQDGKYYVWNEQTQSWGLINI